ncbi:MAG: arylsulfatase [Planctomycetota bacterium]|jgi:arylsulfatase
MLPSTIAVMHSALPPTNARSSRAPLSCLLALGLSLSCSDSDSNPPPAQVDQPILKRVELQLAETRELTPFTLHKHIPPPADWVREEKTGGWEVDIQVKQAGVTKMFEENKESVYALIVSGKTQKTISVHGDFDPRKFNLIMLRLIGGKSQNVQVRCFRGGKPLVSSETFSVPDSIDKKPVGMEFSLPGLQRIEDNFDEIRIRCLSSEGSIALFQVDLAHQAFARYLPLPEDGPALAEIGTGLRELRRGVGLSSEAPLVAEFDVREGSELAFTYGVPESLRTPRAQPKLVLRMTPVPQLAQPIEITREFELESKRASREKARWYNDSIDLAQLAGHRVKLSATLEVDEKFDREALCLLGETRVRVRGRQPQSVLMITSDTHRADHMGMSKPTDADAPRVKTPALDDLGQRGVYFTNCFTATNVTNPSHVALMTAMHVRDTRIVNNHSPLVPQATTVAERFHEAGYRTFAALSANHLVHDESGLGQGFDRMSSPRHADRDAEETIDKLLHWLNDNDGEPVFVWLHLFDAHAPYGPPEGYDRRYYEKDKNPYDKGNSLDIPNVQVPPFLSGVTDSKFPYQQYRAEVDYLDDQLSRVLSMARFQEGIVGFTADHGESFGEHGVWWDHAELYPTTVHVPLIIDWPGAPEGELRIDAPVRQIDLGRTMLNLAGLTDAEFPGRDLRWGIEKPGETEPRYMISAHAFSAAIQAGNWHLILNLRDHGSWAVESKRKAHSVELYNLKDDPECLNNQIDSEMPRAAKMRTQLLEWLSQAKEGGMGSSGGQRSTDAEDALKALGYGGSDESEDVPTSEWYTPDKNNEWVKRFEEY